MVVLLTCACGKVKEVKDNDANYELKYNGITFELGGEFTVDKYGKELEYSETPSCAFEGLDKTYIYDHYEVATYPDGDKDYILSIYFIDTDITTTEGVAIDDTKDKMTRVYGTDYEEENNIITYTKGKTQLIFMFQEDRIISIEYSYVTQ